MKDLPIIWLFFINALAWLFIQIGISAVSNMIPISWFEKHPRLFKSFRWEKEGSFWQQATRVKAWKQYVPDGTLFIKSGYNKKHLHGWDTDSLSDFLLESRRAEFTHWISIPLALLFFLWNPMWAGYINLAYAILFHIPLIILQRYNRPRIERIIKAPASR
ncbi:glycosyl-4,4'-diaponeurosporenoate acyltransferase [Sporosarcina luteola]|nr:glycosyl-4,4'-diaponeurosporenoate acyltransferase [Sporosarcina luteola]